MTANKVTEKLNIITDFTGKKINANKIHKELRQAQIVHFITFKDNDDDKLAIIHNQIKVGNYVIELVLPRKEGAFKLKDYGAFGVKIKECFGDHLLTIKASRHRLFRNQKWIKKIESELRMKDLVDIILFCDKIHRLSIFL